MRATVQSGHGVVTRRGSRLPHGPLHAWYHRCVGATDYTRLEQLEHLKGVEAEVPDDRRGPTRTEAPTDYYLTGIADPT